jgi:hypothetical protein
MTMHRFLDGIDTFFEVVGHLALFVIMVGFIAGIIIALVN